MPIGQDIQTLRRRLRNLVRTRRNRRRVAQRAGAYQPPKPGTIQIAVYFADTRVNMYQLRQWYAPLAELAETWPVAFITRSPSATLALWDEAPIPTVLLRSVRDIEDFLRAQPLRMVFYVNQNTRNFQMFRYPRMWHVFINHGESDKVYMTTNQFKAYDYSFVAGDAARARLAQKLWAFDLDAKTRSIGRPQADHFAGPVPYTPDKRTVVLYAPTWEGDRASAAYGSVASHGVALSRAILASPDHRLIYRPHPRSGVVDRAYGVANQEIVAAIARANAADPSAQHVYDDGPQLGWQLAAADVAITDISAMVYDRLATGKPLIVTRPTSKLSEIDHSGYLGHAEWLEADDASDILNIIDTVEHSAEAQKNLHYWVERHFGDTSPGVATARFHAAVRELADLWDEQAKVHKGQKVEHAIVPTDEQDVED
ncbi:MAG TPA: CDP-glycerol glycerophosphotransferase family protein [Galbitalea sp.]|nr:CDP-glycerol glycerophosphotransferase family protein [Galbitalea sp.]